MRLPLVQKNIVLRGIVTHGSKCVLLWYARKRRTTTFSAAARGRSKIADLIIYDLPSDVLA